MLNDINVVVDIDASANKVVATNIISAKLYGESMISMPKDLYIPPDALEVFLIAFEGPLDLLLYLIRKEGLNILDIPMAKLTQQYLSYIEQIRYTQFELAAEYLLMAAMLIEIKSRMLLPKINTDDDDDIDPRAELVRKLISYEAIKNVSMQIQCMPVYDEDFWIADVISPKIAHNPIFIDAKEILAAFKDIISRQKLFDNHQIIKEQLSVREYMTKTLKYLQQYNKQNNAINNANEANNSKKLSFYDIMLHNELKLNSESIVVYFLAILELVKEGFLTFSQSEAFAPIYLDITYEAS
jgi:segregation and condensation protein A